MIFEMGDDTLIEQLIKDGLTCEQIAKKWEVTTDRLKTYCKRKGVNLPVSPKSRAKRKLPGNTARQAVERGERKSPTVNVIIKLHKAKCTVDQIAAKTGKTKEYVQRMIDVFCNGDRMARHRSRYNAVSGFAKEFRVTLKDAARMLGTSYTAYQYSGKVLGLMK